MDESFLQGNLGALLSPGFYWWHQGLATISAETRRRLGLARPSIKRLLPIYRDDYSPEQVELIKFALHYLLVFGVEILIPFVDTPPATPQSLEHTFLRTRFGSNGRTIYAGGHYADADQMHERNGRVEPVEVTSPAEALEVVDSCMTELSKLRYHVLAYDALTFTSKRDDSLSVRFTEFLANLQGGRCAVGYDHELSHPGHLEHVLPLNPNAPREPQGLPWSGNNALMNLRVVCGRFSHRYEPDCAAVKVPSVVRPPISLQAFPKPSPADLDLLSDRRLQPVQVGPHALETGWFANPPRSRAPGN